MNKKRAKQRKRPPTPSPRRPALRRAPLRSATIPSPLAHLTDEERAAFVDRVIAEAERRFTSGLPELEGRVLAYEPNSLLSYLAFYHLVSPDGIEQKPPGRRPVYQHHVELLQALVLRHDIGAFPWMPTFPEVERLLELLDDTCWAFVFRHGSRPASAQERARLSLQARMRAHTLAVRNWGYPDQIARTVANLFAPLDDRIEATTGVRVVALSAMCSRLIEVVEERWRTHFARVLPVDRARSVRAALDAHERTFPEFAGGAEVGRTLLETTRSDLPVAELKEHLIHHLNLRLPDVYTVDLADAVAAYPGSVDPEALRAVLDGWSWRYGELADRDPQRFFLDNPIWARPLIKQEDGRYFCPIPGLFLGFGLEQMEAVVFGKTPLREAYERRRAKYLEDEVARRFAEAFSSAEVFRGSKWSDPADPSTVYENDLLVRLDTLLFVVEAKAGKFSGAGRRGALESLRSDVAGMLMAASTQGERFADYLRQRPAVHRFDGAHGGNEVDTRGVREVVAINVTLDQLGGLYAAQQDLRAAGLVAEGRAFAPTLTLADLESVFEVLDGEVQKAHYLMRRADLERRTPYMGTELDLLDLYLDTAFNLGELESGETELWLGGRWQRLAPHLMRRSSGTNPKAPRLHLTEWWRDVLARLEERRMPGWVWLGARMLGVSLDEQLRFEREFKATQRIVQRFGDEPRHQDVVYLTAGPAERREAVAGVVFREASREEWRDLAERVGHRAMELAGTSEAVVIGVDVVRRDYPYTAIALVERGPVDDGGA